MAWGTPVSVGTPRSSSGGTTAVLTISSAPSVGDVVIVAVAYSSTVNGISTLTDDAGNTYTQIEARLVNGRCSAQYAALITSVPTAITLTMTGTAGTFMLAAVKASGGSTTVGTQHTNGNGSSGTPSTTWTIDNATTLSISNATRPVVTEDLTAPASWTNIFRTKHATANQWIYMDYALNLSAGSTTWAPTGTSGGWTACSCSYNVASSTSGGGCMMPLMGAGR